MLVVIFAKANRTNQPVTINYVLQEKNILKTVGRLRSISGKIQGKSKLLTEPVMLEVSEKRRYGVIYAFEKLSLMSSSNLISVWFFILPESVLLPTVSASILSLESPREGSWEYVEVLTRYHELLTTEIEE